MVSYNGMDHGITPTGDGGMAIITGGMVRVKVWKDGRITFPGWQNFASYSTITDADLLNAGAILDGVTDISGPLQACIQSIVLASGPVIPKIVWQVGAGQYPVLNPQVCDSGSLTFSIQGVGNGISEIVGGWMHGTKASPSQYQFNFSDVQFTAPSDQSIVGISCYYNADNTTVGIVGENYTLRGYQTPTAFVNVPRNTYHYNGLIYGPDNVMTPGYGYNVSNDGGNAFGVFTGGYLNCMVINYSYGWGFFADRQLEGQRIDTCTCYNGNGMFYVDISPTSLPPFSRYQSPIWYIVNCDWQGYQAFFNGSYVRGVRIMDCYLTFNARPSTVPLEKVAGGWADPEMLFVISAFQVDDFEVSGLTVDINGFASGDRPTIVTADSQSTNVRCVRNQYNFFGNVAVAHWWKNYTTTKSDANRCVDLDCIYSGEVPSNNDSRGIDDDGNQGIQGWLRDPRNGQYDRALGDANLDGTNYVRFSQQFTTADDGKGNQICTITFPTRAGGGPICLNGTQTPDITFSNVGTSILTAFSIEQATANNCVVVFHKATEVISGYATATLYSD